ncbi:MAG TPA: ATP-binding protein [Anaerolineales bacterium]|nr:ATP-binding protein [Anaerolineales bacterium]
MQVSSCPICDSSVEPQFRFCKNCGVDLALAATLAADALSSATAPIKSPVSPEILIPRLGEQLVQRGVITEEALQTALLYQKEQAVFNRPVLLGQALIQLGYLDRATLDQTITAQIIYLQSALSRTNHDLEKRVQEYTADLQQALQKLSELNQLKSNFISNISHELRTPLTHVKGYLELLADESLGPLSTEQTDATHVMTRAVERLETLINDLIKFSETAKGGVSLQLTNVALFRLFESVHTQSLYKAEKRHIELKHKIDGTFPSVMADEENIHWVLSQLVDNAIKFTHPGGKVTYSAVQDGPLAVISVTDTGIGIPTERLDEIFLPFHQLDNSPRRRYGGTGMGLALVKRILEAHGTTLEVESVVAKGTRFQFSLPLVTNSSPTLPLSIEEVSSLSP